MALERKDVEHVAHLARLALSDEELTRFHKQLDNILGYVEKLNQADTTGVEPLVHAAGAGNVMRDDEVRPSLDRGKALAEAPDSDGWHFRVPRIIETGGGH
ncbi:MAG TPA: Asp-tRNA(Asn)/Glu-tRNA(Gln) amidotransferase subunit GatC [Planctomycetota bacterium]|nr:Asp-tRNA(Asn)/Glu-tRNA(Gln) amidotransferase subunit GatC [Planctomycetota bacterium]